MDILCYQPTGSYFWKLLYSLGYLVIVMALCNKKNFIKSTPTCIFVLKWLLPCKSLHNKYHHKHQWWVFMCLASSSFPHLCHKRCTFQLCWHFQCASSKYKLCGTFFHRCYSWTRFFVVFLVVLVESNWTAEFFSTIGKLILNVHGSKSGSQQYSIQCTMR